MIWEVAARISRENLPWGIGLGRFQEVYLSYQPLFPPYLEWAVPEPHNILLALYLSTGLLGLVGFLFLTLTVVRRLLQDPRARSGVTGSAISPARLFLALFLWFFLVGLVDTPYFQNQPSFLFWGLVGLALAFLRVQPAEQETPKD